MHSTMISEAWIVLIFIAVLLALIFGFNAFVIVNEQHQVIMEYWGSYSKILSTGLHFYNALTTSPKYIAWGRSSVFQIPLNEQIFDPPNLTITTDDLCEIGVDIVIHYRIDDVKRAAYNTPNLLNVIAQTVNTSLREICSVMSVHKINRDRGNIVHALICSCDSILTQYGVHIIRAQIQNIKLPMEIVQAQSKAIATQTQVEGELQATRARMERNQMESEATIELKLSQENAEIRRRNLLLDSVFMMRDSTRPLAVQMILLDKWTNVAERCKLVCTDKSLTIGITPS